MEFVPIGMVKPLFGPALEKLSQRPKISSLVSPLSPKGTFSHGAVLISATLCAATDLPRGRTLDGELYIGRNRFDETSGIVRSLRSPRWDELKYMVCLDY